MVFFFPIHLFLFPISFHNILVSSDCYNKILWIEWLEQQMFISHNSGGGKVQHQGAHTHSFLFLACRQTAFPLCPLLLERKSCGFPFFCYKDTNLSMRDPSLHINLNLITTQRFHLQIPSHWGFGFQLMNFEEAQTFSP